MMHLTQREKLLVVASAVLLAVWGLFTFTVKPAIARMKTLERIIPEKRNELARLCAKSEEYISLRRSLDELREKVASQKEGFELLPFLESLIRQCGLAQNAGMKPQTVPLAASYREIIVEIKLEKLALSQLVDFLLKVESSNALVKARTLHIKRNAADPDLLDATVEIHGAQLVEG
jgi:hypothetical protein